MRLEDKAETKRWDELKDEPVRNREGYKERNKRIEKETAEWERMKER